MLSDGLNTEDRWPAYGNGNTQYGGQIDARQKILCDNIKAQGVIIYAIQVNTGRRSDFERAAILRQRPDKFFLVTIRRPDPDRVQLDRHLAVEAARREIAAELWHAYGRLVGLAIRLSWMIRNRMDGSICLVPSAWQIISREQPCDRDTPLHAAGMLAHAPSFIASSLIQSAC